MHIHSLILSTLPLLPTLSSTAPTSTDTDSTLEKRFSWGYVGSYTDPQCGGDWMKFNYNDNTIRPEIRGTACAPFTPHSDNIGINFGTGTYTFHQLTFYTDPACTNKSAIPPAYKPNQWGPGIACVHPSAFVGDGKGDLIGSVLGSTGNEKDLSHQMGY